jgi:hypothetical protein
VNWQNGYISKDLKLQGEVSEYAFIWRQRIQKLYFIWTTFFCKKPFSIKDKINKNEIRLAVKPWVGTNQTVLKMIHE